MSASLRRTYAIPRSSADDACRPSGLANAQSAILAEESRPSAAPASKPDIVFADDFDHFDPKRWDEVSDAPGVIQVVDGGPRVGDHGKCLQVTATLGKDTGGHLYKMLDPGLDECHVRFYVKFEKDHGYVHHFFHLVGYNPRPAGRRAAPASARAATSASPPASSPGASGASTPRRARGTSTATGA